MKNLSQTRNKLQIAKPPPFLTTHHHNTIHQNFKPLKCKKRKKPVKFRSDNTEEYNQPFSLLELTQALQKSNDSAVGPDDIHCKLLTNLPESSLTLLLTAFNSIWESGIFPPSWREATIVAIPKPGKDSSDPNNYCLLYTSPSPRDLGQSRMPSSA